MTFYALQWYRYLIRQMIRNVALVLFTTFKAFENFPKKKKYRKESKGNITKKENETEKKRKNKIFYLYHIL